MIPATILEALFKAKETLGHTDGDHPPLVLCRACSAPRDVTWQDIGGDRGFWTDSTSCAACVSHNEREGMRIALQKRFDTANVPPIHRHYTNRQRQQPCARAPLPACVHQTKVREALATYKVPSWVCLAGPVGTGKTTILTALFCDLIVKDRCDRKFLWHTEAGLFKAADIAGDTSHGKRMKVMQRAARSDIMLLDDMAGNRRALTDWQGGAIRDLIDERHRYERPTFFTTNLQSWKHLEQRYGSHVISRMLEASTDLAVMEGCDLRLGEPDDYRKANT